jgi:predicted lipoprotein
MRRRWMIAAIGIVFGALSLSGCKIVSIEQDASDVAANKFDATAYTDSLWSSHALPYFNENAQPIDQILDAIAVDLDAAGKQYGYRPSDEGSPWSFVIRGSGRVVSKNTTSRAGTLVVTTDAASAHEVTIQIGPVIRGNSLRDALPFVSFKDFTNQLEYADVGKAMTAVAMSALGTTVDAIDAGETVTFLGTMSLNSKSDKIVVTPVSLESR